MSRFHSYLNSTVQILSEYDGDTPFSLFIKRFFSKHKKFGSRDRRLISNYCYQYFRLGKSYAHTPLDERILIGVFLCSEASNQMLETHKPEWNKAADLNISDKIERIGTTKKEFFKDLFPWEYELSEGIEFEEFTKSYFIQPNVFLRTRPGKKETVRLKLKGHHIPFKELSEHTFSVGANSKLDQVLNIDSEVVIQDLSSQKVGDSLSGVLTENDLKVWDCCSASGGKSILAYDLNPTVKLTVSDVRESILHNLEARFKSAGIKEYKRFKADLTQNLSAIPNAPFDVIIADVPCTGSGTWGRTPEQLSYFQESKIEEYAKLQKTMVSNIIPHLKDGGILVYITCSVFKKENEENIEFFYDEFGIKEVKREILKGYNQKADSMFVSVLRRSR